MQSCAHQPSPQVRELIDARTGLLDILKIESLEFPDGMQRLVDGPTSIGVDPDLPGRTQRIADGFQAPDILGQWLTSLSDLHLGGLAAGSLSNLVRLLRPNGWNRAVDARSRS
jgi:hypothetical protein